MSGRTEDLIRDLSRDARPVRPIPRLRTAAVAFVAVWMLAAAAFLLFHGMSPWGLLADAPWSHLGFAGVFAGLALFAAGGTMRALASAVPGRDLAMRSGHRLAILGAILAVGSGLFAAASAGFEPLVPLQMHFSCMSRATALGLLSAIGAGVFLAGGFTPRPWLAAAFAIGAAVALGSLVVHLGCRLDGALHMLLGHALAPLVGAALLALPLALLVRRLGRRGGDRPA